MSILDEARQLVEPSSPRYARYDARVRFLAQLITFLRRHRSLVTLIAGTILLLLILFLSLVGSFFSQAQCQNFVYGEPPVCDAKAFLAPTQFQYANLEGVPYWQQDIPSAPGQYRIRGVAKNVFGAEKYSNEMTFTLLPRDLHLFLPNDAILYGQLDETYLLEHARFNGLATGDHIHTAKWDIQLEDGPAARVRLAQLRIEDSQGRDVTACYRIHAQVEIIPLQPRPITIATKSATKFYDGAPYHPTSYSISDGTLAFGDTLEVNFQTVPADAGSYPLIPICIVRNSAGEDVSHYYRITCVNGLLTVLPRPLTITTGSAEKQYDGKPLTNSQWSLTSGHLLDGHTLQVSLPVQLTVVGTAMNEPTVKILDESGNEIYDNYALNITSGTLTVTPIILKFETDSGNKVYDGTYLRAYGYRHLEGTPVPGHRIRATTIGEQLFAGSSANTIAVSVIAADGTDVTSQGYQIEVDPGILTVTRRPITITSGSAEKLYDGLPLVHREFSVTSGFICQQEGVYWHEFTGSQTEVGSSRNTFSVKISSGRLGGVDVTSSYEIRYQYGILTVKPNPNYTPPHLNPGDSSSSAPGPATPGKDTSIGFPRGSNNTVYATVHSFDKGLGTRQIYFRSASYGNYTGSAWTAPKLYITGELSPLEFAGTALYENAVSSYIEIKLLNDCPVLFPNYSKIFYGLNISSIYNDSYYDTSSMTYGVYWMDDPGYYDMAQMVLTGKEALLEQEYQKHVYATYLDVPLATRYALMKWANSQGIHADSPTRITDIQLAVQNAALYNPDAQDYPPEVDVAVHFLTEAKEGICQHFATAATLLYRCFNIPARYTTGFLTTVTGGATTEITGKEGHAWVEVYQPGVGWISLEVTASGALKPSSADLVIKAASATKQYDGQPFNDQQLKQFTLASGELLPGHRLEVTIFSNNTIYPGTYQNTITSYRILDESGKDVTASYGTIRVVHGQLQILKRSITIASGSATKVADGTPLTCSDFWLAQGSLVEGDQLEVEISGIIAAPGTKENKINSIWVYRTDPLGQKIPSHDFYTIHLLPGKLTILE